MWVLGDLVVSNFGIKSQAVTPVWVQLVQVVILRVSPNMTLAVQ